MNLVIASVYYASLYQQIKRYQINADDAEQFWVMNEA
jgi:hypothetical protein